jgi:hypothetical protein
MNAAYIEKLGYGKHFSELNAESLRNFLNRESEFGNNLAAYKQNGNGVLFKLLATKLAALS